MTGWTIDDAHIESARKAVAPHIVRTPLIPGTSIGPNVWLKLENRQVTGSFKVRGALSFMSVMTPDERQAGVIAASAGNHGMGVAFAARTHQVNTRVFVPKGTPKVKLAGMEALGAEVVVTEHDGYDETEKDARAEKAEGEVAELRAALQDLADAADAYAATDRGAVSPNASPS